MIPIYGYGIFNVCSNEIVQHIIFEYSDPNRTYLRVVKDKEALSQELNTLKNNMQYFLDNEIVKINNTRVYPKVIDVDIGFAGGFERPYIKYVIVFDAPLKDGLNVYEDTYEPEVAEYDYVVTWVFPKGSKVVEVNVGFPYKIINDRVLTFRVHEGSETPGYERIVFKI